MVVLGIDTSTKVGGLGLYDSEKGLIGEMNLALEQTHSQRLMPMVESLLEMAGLTTQDLGGIAITLGPGSFTGTRIGVTTAKTLAQVGDKPIIGISTLEVVAANLAYTCGLVCPIFDARNRRVYTALFRGAGAKVEGESLLTRGELAKSGSGLKRLSDDDSCTIDELLARLADDDDVSKILSDSGYQEPIFFVGDAVAKYQDVIREKLGKQAVLPGSSYQIPRGGIVAELGAKALARGERDDLFSLAPNYLKPSQAEVLWQKKHGK